MVHYALRILQQYYIEFPSNASVTAYEKNSGENKMCVSEKSIMEKMAFKERPYLVESFQVK